MVTIHHKIYALSIFLCLIFLLTPVLALQTGFHLNFDDGLAPSGWTQGGAATWRFSNNYAETITNTFEGYYYKSLGEIITSELSFASKITTSGTSLVWIGNSYGDPDDGWHIPNGSGYALQCQASQSGLWRIINGTNTKVIAISDCASNTVLRADRNSNYGWTLYVNNTATGWYNETSPLTNFTYGQFLLNTGVSGNKIDDFNFTHESQDQNKIYVTVWDEKTATLLSGATVTIDSNIQTTNSNGLAIFDSNTLFGDTSVEKTIVLTKTGYSTRYYTVDVNNKSDVSINFALINDVNDSDIDFKFYQTNQTSVYANVYAELKDKDTNYIVGRLKTNSSGEATFNLKTNDQNYYEFLNNGEVMYSPVVLTILYPKNEETQIQISELYEIEVTQNHSVSYTNLNAVKTIYLLPNVATSFNINISDVNGNYFSRNYATQYIGNPLVDTLQPYLVPSTTGLLTTITTIDSLNLLPVANINIKLYKYIGGLGRTYVEEITTDDKGQSLILLVLNANYEFDIYQNSVFLRTDSITATSNTIFIKIPGVSSLDRNFTYYSLNTVFNPSRSKIIASDTNLKQTITLSNSGSSIVTISSIKIWAVNEDINGINNNDRNLFYKLINSPASNYINNIGINNTTKTIDGNKYDTNGVLKVFVFVTLSDGNTFLYNYFYSFPTQKSFKEGMSVDVKGIFGCSTSDPLIPCPGLLLVSLFLAIIFTIGLAIETGMNSMGSIGIMFLGFMGLFTFFEWVPYLLYGLMIITFIVIEVAGGGNKI